MTNEYPPPPAPQGGTPAGGPGVPYGAPQQGAPQYGAPQHGAPQYGAPQYGAPASTKKTLAVLSVVFGGISILFSLFLPIIWILFGIAAVVLGAQSRRREPSARTLATVGLVLGVVGIVCNVVSMIVGALFAVSTMQ